MSYWFDLVQYINPINLIIRLKKKLIVNKVGKKRAIINHKKPGYRNAHGFEF